MKFLSRLKPIRLEAVLPKPMYFKGQHMIIWGEHVATWAKDCYQGDKASQSHLDFHGKWGKSQTDRNVTMSLVIAYTGS
jgi:hypothetical protein